MKRKERRSIHSPYSSVHISYALPSIIFNKRERQASDRRQLDVYLFAFLSSRFAHVFRYIVIGVGTLSSTNLFALRHREKAQQLAPLGLRGSLTHLMWVLLTCFRLFYLLFDRLKGRGCIVSFWEMG